jgi:predicted nucleotidyltransferase
MLDMETLKNEIIERLKPLNPNKVILFGSYAYGTPKQDSDIDIFLIKDDLNIDDTRNYEIQSHLALKDLIKKYKVGFDILSAPTDFINQREDYFYKVDILEKGKVLYSE